MVLQDHSSTSVIQLNSFRNTIIQVFRVKLQFLCRFNYPTIKIIEFENFAEVCLRTIRQGKYILCKMHRFTRFIIQILRKNSGKKYFSQYFWATYFHPKEKGRVMCALQYLHVSISNYTKAVLGTSFRCLCLSLPQIMHISFLFIFDAVYLGMERISTSSFFSPFSFV